MPSSNKQRSFAALSALSRHAGFMRDRRARRTEDARNKWWHDHDAQYAEDDADEADHEAPEHVGKVVDGVRRSRR